MMAALEQSIQQPSSSTADQSADAGRKGAEEDPDHPHHFDMMPLPDFNPVKRPSLTQLPAPEAENPPENPSDGVTVPVAMGVSADADASLTARAVEPLPSSLKEVASLQALSQTPHTTLLPTYVARTNPLPAQKLPPLLLSNPQNVPDAISALCSLSAGAPAGMRAASSVPADISALQTMAATNQDLSHSSCYQSSIQPTPAVMHPMPAAINMMPAVMLPAAPSVSGGTAPVVISPPDGQTVNQIAQKQPRHRSLADLMKIPRQAQLEGRQSTVVRLRPSLREDILHTSDERPLMRAKEHVANDDGPSRPNDSSPIHIQGAAATIRSPVRCHADGRKGPHAEGSNRPGPNSRLGGSSCCTQAAPIEGTSARSRPWDCYSRTPSQESGLSNDGDIPALKETVRTPGRPRRYGPNVKVVKAAPSPSNVTAGIKRGRPSKAKDSENTGKLARLAALSSLSPPTSRSTTASPVTHPPADIQSLPTMPGSTHSVTITSSTLPAVSLPAFPLCGRMKATLERMLQELHPLEVMASVAPEEAAIAPHSGAPPAAEASESRPGEPLQNGALLARSGAEFTTPHALTTAAMACQPSSMLSSPLWGAKSLTASVLPFTPLSISARIPTATLIPTILNPAASSHLTALCPVPVPHPAIPNPIHSEAAAAVNTARHNCSPAAHSGATITTSSPPATRSGVAAQQIDPSTRPVSASTLDHLLPPPMAATQQSTPKRAREPQQQQEQQKPQAGRPQQRQQQARVSQQHTPAASLQSVTLPVSHAIQAGASRAAMDGLTALRLLPPVSHVGVSNSPTVGVAPAAAADAETLQAEVESLAQEVAEQEMLLEAEEAQLAAAATATAAARLAAATAVAQSESAERRIARLYALTLAKRRRRAAEDRLAIAKRSAISTVSGC